MLIVAGSDRRGTAFGLTSLSRAIGVSPWYWWADVTPAHKDQLYVQSGRYVEPGPSVQYRGIFINDERFGGWARWVENTFDTDTHQVGHKVYEKVFELLLHLRGNYLWPAMHPGTQAFNFDPENARLADDYAIVMGTSHCEQMLRNNEGEWKAVDEQARREGRPVPLGDFNYITNRQTMQRYWEERVKTNGRYENTYTLGLRGIHDYPMEGANTTAERVKLMQRRMTGSEELFGYFCMAYGLDPEVGANEPEVLCSFALAAASIDQSPRAYSSRELVDEIFAYNENKLQQMGLEDYSTEMMLYMILNDRVLIDQEFFDWYQRNFVTEGTANGPRHARLKEDVKLEYKHKLLLPVFGVDEEIWNQDPTLAYSYQAAHELGYFDMRFDYYFDDPEDADMVNAMWMSLYNNVLEAEMGEVYAGVEYSPELFTFVRQQTAQAEKPILFIYGGDDIWTGAHMEDEHVNGDNVRLYVLPEQNHRASISAVTDTSLQNELWAFTDAVFSNKVGITQLSDDASAPARYYDLYGRRVSEKALQGKEVVKR